MAKRKILGHLDYASVMHPDDKKTIDRLNGIKAPFVDYTFQDFLRSTTSKYREAYNEVENQGEGINITEESLPQMYQLLVDCCNVLGIEKIPAYSTDWFYGPYHFSNGETNRRIVMMSGSADLFTDEEMSFILGHELGHMACGHKPYHMLLETFYMPFINDAAFKAWATIIKLPLLEWYRNSDFSADRVGLLCCQDINVALSTLIKKAGLPQKCYDNIHIDSFLQQAKEFEEHITNTVDQVVKFLSIRSAEFPWLVVRAGKLYNWYNSGEYQQIIDNQ